MNRRLLVIVCAIPCAAALAACASGRADSGSVPHSAKRFSVWVRRDVTPTRRVLPVPADVVWAALPQVFADLGFPGGASSRDGERVYLTPSLTIRGRLYEGELNSNYLECGRTAAGARAADAYTVTFAILTRLSSRTADSTLVEVLVDGTARDQTHQSGEVFCSGTGRLENTVLERLAAHLGSRSRRP